MPARPVPIVAVGDLLRVHRIPVLSRCEWPAAADWVPRWNAAVYEVTSVSDQGIAGRPIVTSWSDKSELYLHMSVHPDDWDFDLVEGDEKDRLLAYIALTDEPMELGDD